jgi:hypothetical protein
MWVLAPKKSLQGLKFSFIKYIVPLQAIILCSLVHSFISLNFHEFRWFQLVGKGGWIT